MQDALPGGLARKGREAGRVRSPPAASRAAPLSSPGRPGAGEVRDVVLRRMDNPVLLVQIDHRRLDVRMAQHGLHLPDGGPMIQGQRGRRMAERMGRDRPETVGLGIEQPTQARLLQMVPHHGLNRPDA